MPKMQVPTCCLLTQSIPEAKYLPQSSAQLESRLTSPGSLDLILRGMEIAGIQQLWCQRRFLVRSRETAFVLGTEGKLVRDRATASQAISKRRR